MKKSLHLAIQDYELAPALKYPRNDCEEFQKRLKATGEFDDCRVLVGGGLLRNQSIDPDTVIEVVRDMISTLKSGDLFVFSFSGHGVRDSSGELHLLFPTADPRRPGNVRRKALPLSELLDVLRGPFDTLLLMDNCRLDLDADRNQAGARGVGAADDSGQRSFIIPADDSTGKSWGKNDDGSTIVLYACRDRTPAWEVDEVKLGLFHAALFAEFDRCLREKTPFVVSTDLLEPLKEHMAHIAEKYDSHGAQHKGGQRPWIEGDGKIVLFGEGGASGGRPPAPIREFWLSRDEDHPVEGPYEKQDLIKLAKKSEFTAKTMICLVSTEHWESAAKTDWLRSYVENQKKQKPRPPVRDKQDRPRTRKKHRGILLRLSRTAAIEMVYIPKGVFMMGSPVGETGRQEDEFQRKVKFTDGFWIGKYPVTQGQWDAVMEQNPSKFKISRKHPVEKVSWHDAKAFCDKLNRAIYKKGYKYNLPTEAMWEYACRAGTIEPFPYGEELSDKLAHYGTRGGTVSVEGRGYKANAWGLFHMIGNVSEWCEDWYGKYIIDDLSDPMGPSEGGGKVVRGGNHNSSVKRCRSASRGSANPTRRSSRIGFRLCLRPSSD